jgi:hypothetical protein
MTLIDAKTKKNVRKTSGVCVATDSIEHVDTQ